MFFALSFSSLIAVCIESDSIPKKTSLGVSFAPHMSYRSLQVDTAVQFMDYYKTHRDNYESEKFGFQIAVDFRYQISKSITLKTGFSFEENGYRIRNGSWWDSTIIAQLGNADVKYQLRYIGIPITLMLHKNFQDFRLFFQLGFSFDYLYQNRIKSDVDFYSFYPSLKDGVILTDREDESIAWNIPVWELKESRLNFSTSCSFGIEANLSNRISLSIGPKMNYYWLSIFKDPILENNYNIGLNFGINYRF